MSACVKIFVKHTEGVQGYDFEFFGPNRPGMTIFSANLLPIFAGGNSKFILTSHFAVPFGA